VGEKDASMSEDLSVILVVLRFPITGIIGFKMYNSQEISNRKIDYSWLGV
jgi:hypothetical protein